MKAYLATTGVLFGLVAVAHLWRVVAESRALARDPWFILLTVLAVGLCIWAFYLLRRRAREH